MSEKKLGTIILKPEFTEYPPDEEGEDVTEPDIEITQEFPSETIGLKEDDDDSEIKEYNFEEGVNVAIARLQEILNQKSGAVVAITGRSNDVGKSYLQAELEIRLVLLGFHSLSVTEIKSLELSKPLPRDKIIILGAEYSPFGFGRDPFGPNDRDNPDFWKKRQDTALREALGSEYNTQFDKIDLRIFICRPDKIFVRGELKYADVVICNERASDNPRKFR